MSELKDNELIYEFDNGECPYLPDRCWKTQYFISESFDVRLYESLIVDGWRRSSYMFYKNNCDNCDECKPIRVDLRRFKPSKSQRRVLRRNQDVTVSFSRTTFRYEDLELFNRYTEEWHKSDKTLDIQGFCYFVFSPIDTLTSHYYIGEQLVGVGWMDVLQESVSSVYFAFDPDFSERRLGTYSILKEIEWAREHGKSWLQLGFWVKDCRRMVYKENFRPNQISVKKSWVPHKEL